jgi:hypothetical protein
MSGNSVMAACLRCETKGEEGQGSQLWCVIVMQPQGIWWSCLGRCWQPSFLGMKPQNPGTSSSTAGHGTGPPAKKQKTQQGLGEPCFKHRSELRCPIIHAYIIYIYIICVCEIIIYICNGDAMQCITMQCNATQRNAMQCNVMQCI